MKRHPALEPLSRDHHHALVVAQRLKRADPASAAEARASFMTYWEDEGRTHFRHEEEILLPACVPFVDPDEPVVAKVLTEHVRIRHLAGALAGVSRPEIGLLHDLGRQLDDHVRREERELFRLIECSLPDETLRELVTLLGPGAAASE